MIKCTAWLLYSLLLFMNRIYQDQEMIILTTTTYSKYFTTLNFNAVDIQYIYKDMSRNDKTTYNINSSA